MGIIGKKALEYSTRIVKDIKDVGNPFTLDGADFFLEIGKTIIKIGKELL